MRRSLGMYSFLITPPLLSNGLHLVGFESPNFGHAFLDGFDDIDRDDYSEDANYSGDEQFPPRVPRIYNRGGDMGRSRPRPTALEGGNVRFNHPPPPRMNGLRDLSSSKWQDNKHSPSDVVEQYSHLLLMSEPEPSLDDRLVAPPPDWATCCVCHEVSLCSFSFNTILYSSLYLYFFSCPTLHHTFHLCISVLDFIFPFIHFSSCILHSER